MKVGILTYARTNNYGATLQCYALDKYIRSLGHETIILNVPLTGLSSNNVRRSLCRRILGLPEKVLKKIYRKVVPSNAPTIKPYEVRYQLTQEQRQKEQEYSDQNMRLFDEFRAKYMPNLTKEYLTVDDLKNDYPDADAFVVGSDQVWNVNICLDQYPIFFLGFVKPNHKRIAYAACMGGDSNFIFEPKQKVHVKELLSKFDSILVRNEMAVNICRNNFGIDPKQVMDPTFLIDDYNELLAESNVNAAGDFFVDKFVINDVWMDIVREIASRTNLNIRMDRCLVEIKDVPFNPVCKVQDWLGILNTADLIFTDSFHCSVFCILFKRQFVVAPSYHGGEGRMIDLLKKLGLEDRFYSNPKDLIDNFEVWNKTINYDEVYNKINKLKIDSRQLLVAALS